MKKGGVNHSIRFGSSAAQAFEVIEIAAVHLSAGASQRLGASVGARKSKYLVA